jgi:G:T/U-mismatch repair DNA glycosylase
LTKIRAQGVAERHKLEDQQSATLAKQSSDALAQVKAENDAIIKGADEQFQVWDEGYKGQIEVAKIASETKIQLITQDFEKGKITQQQEIALIAQEKERELEIEKLTQQKRWALWDGDKKKQQEVQNQIDKIIAQSKQVQTKAVTDGLKAQEQQYKQVFSQIGNSFKTEILGMIQGTETVAQGFAKMFNSLISSFADYVAQKAEKKAEEWLIDKLFTEKKIGSETAAATGIASMAGFASAMQALPFPINVSMAPAVAAAAGATASGMGAIAMGAASLAIGTDYVPMDGLAYLHKGEKVIPASMQGPGYSGGAGITIVVNHSVSAVDAASFQGHIRRHSNMIANEVTRALKRKGAR